MIRSFIEAMLGDFGRQLLYIYEANAFIINSVIVIYGLFMFLAWNNLVRVYRFLILEVAKTVHLDEELDRKSTNKRIRDTVMIPWDKAVEVAPFPFIGHVGALLPKRMSVENLQLYFEEKEIVDRAMKLLKGTHIKRLTPSSRRIGERLRSLRRGERPILDPSLQEDEIEATKTKE